MKKLKVAAYCRVSTDMEDQLHSLSTQIRYFTDYIGNHENYELIEVYYDEGITGTSTKKRDGFNRMISDCEAGLIDLILTKEVSRFARNTVDTLSFTRQLTALGIGVIFMNDNIDTREKDGELRLTIMACIAQEESRKISERVKWGMKRNMENGIVYGWNKMLGYRVIDRKLVVVPEEAEIVRRIFNSYVYERKGCHLIAADLNAEGIEAFRGGRWAEDAVLRVLKNDKYVGDLTQWKYYTESYLSKKRIRNKGNNPECPLITVKDHHEPIVSRELWNKAQEQIEARGRLVREGKRHSNKHWHTSKVICGKCGSTYNINAIKGKTNLSLHCINRSRFGTEKKTLSDGTLIGCDNTSINEQVLNAGMKYILEHIRISKDIILERLINNIMEIQEMASVDTKSFEDEIEKISIKKRKLIDIMLDGLISSSDMKQQVEYYDKEIARLSEEMTIKKGTTHESRNQLDEMRKCVEKIKSTESIDTSSTKVYNEMIDKIIVNEDKTADFYLNCVPFGFRLAYHTYRDNIHRKFEVIIDSCSKIESA